MESFSGWVPVGASEGIDTFTWYNPTKVGAKPLKMKPVGLPPMVTVGATWECVSTVADAGSPDDCGRSTGPSPLAQIAMLPPRLAWPDVGFDGAQITALLMPSVTGQLPGEQ